MSAHKKYWILTGAVLAGAIVLRLLFAGPLEPEPATSGKTIYYTGPMQGKGESLEAFQERTGIRLKDDDAPQTKGATGEPGTPGPRGE